MLGKRKCIVLNACACVCACVCVREGVFMCVSVHMRLYKLCVYCVCI